MQSIKGSNDQPVGERWEKEICPDCRGTGEIINPEFDESMKPDFYCDDKAECPLCGGDGEIWTLENF